MNIHPAMRPVRRMVKCEGIVSLAMPCFQKNPSLKKNFFLFFFLFWGVEGKGGLAGVSEFVLQRIQILKKKKKNIIIFHFFFFGWGAGDRGDEAE